MTRTAGASDLDGLPTWLATLSNALPSVCAEDLTHFLPPEQGGRASAVLVLFGEGADGPDVLLIERASTMRSHAGQPAFPGGAQDPQDADATACALREAQEEVGLDPATVEVLEVLPALWLPPSGFVVHPVIGYWQAPHPVHVVDPNEVAAVLRPSLAELVDPANRLRVTHPSGFTGPAFEVGGLLVWGFTAGLLDKLLELGGWALPWDGDRRRELDPETIRLSLRTTAPRDSSARANSAHANSALTQEFS